MFCIDLQANATAGIQSGRIYFGSLDIHTCPRGFLAHVSVCTMSASLFTDEQTSPGLLININLPCILQLTVSTLSLYPFSYHFNPACIDVYVHLFISAAKALAACNKAVRANQKSPDPVRGMLTFCKLAPSPCWHLQQSGPTPMVVALWGGAFSGLCTKEDSNIHEQFTRLYSCKTLQ